MHLSRFIILFGVVASTAALSSMLLATDGTVALAELSRTADVPAAIPTIWGGMDVGIQIVIGIIGVILVVVALRPSLDTPLSRTAASFVSLAGVALSGFALFKFVETASRATSLETSFATAFDAGLVPTAYTVSTGVGLVILVVGMLLITIGGLLSLRTPPGSAGT